MFSLPIDVLLLLGQQSVNCHVVLSLLVARYARSGMIQKRVADGLTDVTISNCNDVEYRIGGLLGRFGDEPSIVGFYGTKYWFYRGFQHRENDKPAVVVANGGGLFWYRKGKLHRDGGLPAIINKFHMDFAEWYIDGVLQRQQESYSSYL